MYPDKYYRPYRGNFYLPMIYWPITPGPYVIFGRLMLTILNAICALFVWALFFWS